MTRIDRAAHALTCKVAYLGIEGAGVDANLAWFREADAAGTDLTRPVAASGVAVVDLGEIGGWTVRVQVHAAPGAPHLRAARRRALAGADAVVVVLDAQRARLDATRAAWAALPSVLAEAGLPADRVPVVCQSNKADLPAAARVPRATLDALVGHRGHAVVEAAAVSGVGVWETLEAATRAALAPFLVEAPVAPVAPVAKVAAVAAEPRVVTEAPAFTPARPVVHADHLGASTFIEKGWGLLARGEPAAAEAALRRALDLAPGEAQATALLGWAVMLQDRYDEALAHFTAVLAMEPTNALCRVNLGYIGLRQGRYAEAIEHLSRAIRLDTDRKATLYAHFYLGLVYLERDRPDEALHFLTRTLTLGPNLVEARYALGFAYWARGETDAACAAWEAGAANRFNPWGARCADALRAARAGTTPARER